MRFRRVQFEDPLPKEEDHTKGVLGVTLFMVTLILVAALLFVLIGSFSRMINANLP